MAKFLGLKGTGSISRTIKCMVEYREERGSPAPLVEQVDYSSAKVFRLTPHGQEILLQNVKLLEETRENTGSRAQNVKPSENVKPYENLGSKSRSSYNHGFNGSRAGVENVKPYENPTWRLHKKKRTFELVPGLDEKDLGKIYTGFSDRYRVVLNNKMVNNPQLTMDYLKEWQEGEVRFLKVSFRIVASRKNPKIHIYGPQVEHLRERSFDIYDLEDLHDQALEQIIPQLEHDIRTIVPKFRIKRAGPGGQFIWGVEKERPELAWTDEPASKKNPPGNVHIIKAYDGEPIYSMDHSKKPRPELEGIGQSEEHDPIDAMDKVSRFYRLIESGQLTGENILTLFHGIVTQMGEFSGQLRLAQDQQNQLREDVSMLVKIYGAGA